MSEGTERPQTDAWAEACAEDLAAERARRRQARGADPGTAAEELRKLADAVADKVAELGSPAATMAAKAVFSQVKAAVVPLRDRNPDVFEHLTAAGSELLAAYRAAVAGAESRWTRGAAGPADRSGGGDPAGPERIDLD